MQECLRVEKLPCIFLEKRESLFIILSAGSKGAVLSVEIHWKSITGRWTMKLNLCGVTNTSIMSLIINQSQFLHATSVPTYGNQETSFTERKVRKNMEREQQMQSNLKMQSSNMQGPQSLLVGVKIKMTTILFRLFRLGVYWKQQTQLHQRIREMSVFSSSWKCAFWRRLDRLSMPVCTCEDDETPKKVKSSWSTPDHRESGQNFRTGKVKGLSMESAFFWE